MVTRWIFAVLGLAFTGIGLVGVAVPGLPTVPFLLVAAACGRRGWPGLARRLERHPRWGEQLRDWRLRRCVPRRAKHAAGAMMVASLSLLVVAGAPVQMLAVIAAVMGFVLAWLWERPEGRTARDGAVAP